MRSARVLDGRLSYPEKEISEIKKLFDSRYNLYKDCYNHRVTQSFECLILDILCAAQGLRQWTRDIRDPDLFMELDDTILHEIRISEEPCFEGARQLLERFDSRKHYSFVAEKVLETPMEVCE